MQSKEISFMQSKETKNIYLRKTPLALKDHFVAYFENPLLVWPEIF